MDKTRMLVIDHSFTTLNHPLPTLRRDRELPGLSACGATTRFFYNKGKARCAFFMKMLWETRIDPYKSPGDIQVKEQAS
jgi:hypothetical protein